MKEPQSKIVIYSLASSIFLMISCLLIYGYMIFILRKNQAIAFEKSVAEHILLDNRREVLIVLNQAVLSGFVRVDLQTKNYSGILSVGAEKPGFWDISIPIDVYFDSEKKFRAGVIEFYYYPLEMVYQLLAVWIGISIIAAGMIAYFFNKQFKIQIERSDAQKSRAILDVVNSLAHDIRAPLGSFERLLLLPDLVKLGPEKKILRESLNRIYSMIDSLRRSEAETIVLRTPLRISQLDFLEGTRIKSEIRNISVAKNIACECDVSLDQQKFERSIINLVSNALDFANSRVIVEVLRDNIDLVIRVSDDGPGVPDNFLPRLFQRGATHGKHDGTGLGLAYVRQIMRGHGGDVTYRRENNMTVFECYLPNAVVEMSKEDEQNAQQTLVYPKVSEPGQPELKQVSICFKSAELNQRVFERLSGLSQSSYSFVLGLSPESSIVLTDSEDLADQLPDKSARPILMSSMVDDDIVRRVPTRLGIKG